MVDAYFYDNIFPFQYFSDSCVLLSSDFWFTTNFLCVSIGFNFLRTTSQKSFVLFSILLLRPESCGSHWTEKVYYGQSASELGEGFKVIGKMFIMNERSGLLYFNI